MSKGTRNRQQRRQPIREQYTIAPSNYCAFCLPDTPDNRNLVAMLTGENAAKYATGNGMLDNTREQKNSGDCEAVKLQSPLS